jgi:hypothetical protein
MNDIEKAVEHLKRLKNDFPAKCHPILYSNHCERIDLAISALEKQIPKKCETDEENNFYNCPCCNEDLMGCYGENDETAKHCLWCGQKLLWEESE